MKNISSKRELKIEVFFKFLKQLISLLKNNLQIIILEKKPLMILKIIKFKFYTKLFSEDPQFRPHQEEKTKI